MWRIYKGTPYLNPPYILEIGEHPRTTIKQNLKFRIIMARQTKITSGKFATGEGSKGNFTGYNAKGERVFIHKAQMESIGMSKNEDFKPFYALIDEKDIQTRDENGELTDIMVKRLQALSVFKSAEDLISAVNADSLLEIQAKQALVASAKSSGLDQKAVDLLLANAI